MTPSPVTGDWLTELRRCTADGGTLAKVETAEENSLVQRLLVDHGSQVAWIGLQDFLSEGNFTWSDGAQQHHDASLGSYTNWADNQPNNNAQGQVRYMSHVKCNVTCDVQHCVVMRADGRWNDVICGGDRPAVCMRLP